MILIIIIADNWSITVTELPHQEYYYPFIMFFGSLEFIVTGVGRIFDGHWKVTEFDGPVAYYHFALRGLMFIWFIANLKSLYDKEETNKHIRKFNIVGGVYFWGMPMI